MGSDAAKPWKIDGQPGFPQAFPLPLAAAPGIPLGNTPLHRLAGKQLPPKQQLAVLQAVQLFADNRQAALVGDPLVGC